MLVTIALVFGGFACVVWRACRRGRSAQPFSPQGKLRWGDEPAP
jgi:hypothetical protein